ncbi:uncharacterized protein DFL_004442 [Arthrobotrys flagrans]|uniref:BTB domain-containing protein n=1 Tax=Arthrobotrys flagrans TaxID=97331 RepID=A0A437A4N5_ARTFL|nr:hypothetical protein DFL_004442 [Arthrobotrys flagrans]
MTSRYAYESSRYFSYKSPDVVLVVGNGEEKTTFNVHEAMIGPPSAFFKAALNIGLKETHERKINLPEITWLGMLEVLNWLYRKEVWKPKLREAFSEQATEKFLAIFTAIDFLQIPQLTDNYKEVLEELLSGLNGSSLVTADKEEGGRVALLIHELYKIGGSIDEHVFLSVLKVLRINGSGLPASINGFLGFRNFVYEHKDPNPKFLHDLCKAYGFC